MQKLYYEKTPLFINAYNNHSKSFIDDQFSQVILNDYIDCKEISKVQLIKQKDTIPIEYCQDFFQVIGSASYNQGMWKHYKSMKIVIWKKDGTKDSILTNGNLFELSSKRFFKAEENLIEKYMQAWQIKILNDN